MAKKSLVQTQDKYVLRMPDGLRDRVKSHALHNDRSMNTEICRVLEAAFPAPVEPEGAQEELVKVLQHLIRWHDQLSAKDIAMAKEALAKAGVSA